MRVSNFATPCCDPASGECSSWMSSSVLVYALLLTIHACSAWALAQSSPRLTKPTNRFMNMFVLVDVAQ